MNGWVTAEFLLFLVVALIFVFFLIFKIARRQNSLNETKIIQRIEELHDDIMSGIKQHVMRKSIRPVNPQVKHLTRQDNIEASKPVLNQMKEDLITVLEGDNVFQMYAQTVFNYDYDYISDMKRSNRVLFGFFFKRFIVKYHYLMAICYEKKYDHHVIHVQTTLFFFFLTSSLFVCSILSQQYDNFRDILTYSLLYNNLITVPLTLFALKVMNNLTDIYKKIKLYFMAERKDLAIEQLKNKNKLLNLCSYLVLIIFILSVIEAVYFGQTLSDTDSKQDGSGIYSWLIVIGADFVIGRFLFCLIFLLIIMIQKLEKSDLIASAKEILFYQHILNKKNFDTTIHNRNQTQQSQNNPNLLTNKTEENMNTEQNMLPQKRYSESKQMNINNNNLSELNDQFDDINMQESESPNKEFKNHKRQKTNILTQSLRQNPSFKYGGMEQSLQNKQQQQQSKEQEKQKQQQQQDLESANVSVIKDEVPPNKNHVFSAGKKGLRFEDLKDQEDNTHLYDMKQLKQLCLQQQQNQDNNDLSEIQINFDNEIQQISKQIKLMEKTTQDPVNVTNTQHASQIQYYNQQSANVINSNNVGSNKNQIQQQQQQQKKDQKLFMYNKQKSMSGILNQSEMNDYFPPTPKGKKNNQNNNIQPHQENMKTVTENSNEKYYIDTQY